MAVALGLSLVKLNLGNHRLISKALKNLLVGKISKSTPILFILKPIYLFIWPRRTACGILVPTRD